jgi:hypothetical protein
LQDRVAKLKKAKQVANHAARRAREKLQRKLKGQCDKAEDTVEVLSETEAETVRMWAVRHEQLNKGMRPEFEEHARCLMATGSTARQTRESLILNAGHFLGITSSSNRNLKPSASSNPSPFRSR